MSYLRATGPPLLFAGILAGNCTVTVSAATAIFGKETDGAVLRVHFRSSAAADWRRQLSYIGPAVEPLILIARSSPTVQLRVLCGRLLLPLPQHLFPKTGLSVLGGPPILSTSYRKSASGQERRSVFVALKNARISAYRERTSSYMTSAVLKGRVTQPLGIRSPGTGQTFSVSQNR